MTTFADCAEAESKGVIVEESCADSASEAGSTADFTLMRYIDPHPFVPAGDQARHDRCEEIINIQVAALAKRLDAINCKTLTVGISGGLDFDARTACRRPHL